MRPFHSPIKSTVPVGTAPLDITSTTVVPNLNADKIDGLDSSDLYSFKTIAVSGQSDVVAEVVGDTLTLVGGSGIAITTSPTGDSVTIGMNAAGIATTIKRQTFIATAGQTLFNLTSGSYVTGANLLSVFIWGTKQSSAFVAETSSTSFTLAVGLDVDTVVVAEWYEDVNVTTTSLTYIQVASQLNPVGTVREFNVATNPNTLLGFGTWAAYGTGRTTIAIDGTQTEFDTLGETGGEKAHTLTSAESGIANHNHTASSGTESATHTHGVDYGIIHSDGTSYTGEYLGGVTLTWGAARIRAHANTVSTESATHNHTITVDNNTGASAANAHNNLQPYIVVYRWVRTA